MKETETKNTNQKQFCSSSISFKMQMSPIFTGANTQSKISPEQHAECSQLSTGSKDGFQTYAHSKG
jgi:hypothetical protein